MAAHHAANDTANNLRNYTTPRDSCESWGSEGRSMAQKLMVQVVARAQCALLKAHGGMAKAP